MASALVTAAVAPLQGEPSVRAEQVSQAVLGEAADLVAREGDWHRVRLARDGYEGWLHAGYVRSASDDEAGAWREAAVLVSEGAEALADGARVRLPLGARVAAGGAGGELRLPDGRTARLVAGRVTPEPERIAASRGVAPEEWALDRFGGAPYEWGGITPWGVDCSGLVQATFLARGTRLPRDASQQVACGEPVEPAEARAGDLLFFSERAGRVTHVAFLAAAGTLVHSTLACGGVLREPWGDGSRAAALRAQLVAVRRVSARARP